MLEQQMIIYIANVFGIFIFCYLGAIILVKYPKVAVITTAVAVLLFVLRQLIYPPPMHYGISAYMFQYLKGFSVFIPIVIYAWLNYRHKNKASKPHKFFGAFFSTILAANIFEVIFWVVGFHGKTNIILIVLIVILALSAFFLKWDMHGKLYGFKCYPWPIANFFCLTYVYFFVVTNIPAYGLFSFVVLLVPYIPLSRIKADWFGYRAYSLFLYLILLWVFDYDSFIIKTPAAINNAIFQFQKTFFNEALLWLAVLSVIYLCYWLIFKSRSV